MFVRCPRSQNAKNFLRTFEIIFYTLHCTADKIFVFTVKTFPVIYVSKCLPFSINVWFDRRKRDNAILYLTFKLMKVAFKFNIVFEHYIRNFFWDYHEDPTSRASRRSQIRFTLNLFTSIISSRFRLKFVRNRVKFGSASLFDSNFHAGNTNESLCFWISCMNDIVLLIISASRGLTPSS